MIQDLAKSYPLIYEYKNPALNESPAAVVSMASHLNAGILTSSSFLFMA